MQSQQAKASTAGNSRTSHFMHEVQEAVTHPVESHPISTSLLVFGAGLGLGALIGSMIAESSARPATRFSQAEALGRSILDSLSSAIPDSVSRHMHK